MRGAIRKSARRQMSGEGPGTAASLGSGGEAARVLPEGPAPLPPDELRERDERLLDADAERWIAEWGGDD